MALNLPSLDLRDLGRRIPVTEEACEPGSCPCFKAGFYAGVRMARERRRAHEERDGVLACFLALVATGVFFALFLIWLARG